MICLCFTKIGQLTFPTDDEQDDHELETRFGGLFPRHCLVRRDFSKDHPIAEPPSHVSFPYYSHTSRDSYASIGEFGEDGLPLRIRGCLRGANQAISNWTNPNLMGRSLTMVTINHLQVMG